MPDSLMLEIRGKRQSLAREHSSDIVRIALLTFYSVGPRPVDLCPTFEIISNLISEIKGQRSKHLMTNETFKVKVSEHLILIVFLDVFITLPLTYTIYWHHLVLVISLTAASPTMAVNLRSSVSGSFQLLICLLLAFISTLADSVEVDKNGYILYCPCMG